MPFDASGRWYSGYSQGNQPAFPTLTPEEETSAASLLDYPLQGLGWAGSVLDKTFGGRAVRGVLGGKPEELLSIIPFSDTLGITDSQNSVSGRDLLEKSGMLDANQEGFDWGDLAGVGAELALDPATYLTFGGAALTKAGQAAKKAGTLGKTTAQRIAAGQGGHAALGLPFMRESMGQMAFDASPVLDMLGTVASPITGAVKKGAKAVDNLTGGKLGETLAGAGRSARASFDPTVMEQTNPIAQRIAPDIYRQRELNTALGQEDIAKLARSLGPEQAASQDLRYLVEDSPVMGPFPKETTEAAGKVKSMLGDDLQKQLDWSIPVKKLEHYHPRHVTRLEGVEDVARGSEGGGGPFSLGAMQGREKILRDLPTEMVNRMSADAQLVGAGRLPVRQAATLLKTQYGLPGKYSRKLADFLGSLDPKRLEEGLFTKSPLVDLADYKKAASQRMATAEVVQRSLAEAATTQALAGPGALPLKRVLTDMGFSRRLGVQSQGLLGNKLDMYIPKDMAEQLTNGAKAFLVPEQSKGMLKVWDTVTNFFKTSMTTPWPAFHARNAVSAFWQNWVLGVNSAEPYKAARVMLENGAIPGAENLHIFQGRGLNAKQATEELSNLAYAHRVTGTHWQDLSGPADESVKAMMQAVPGVMPSGGLMAEAQAVGKQAITPTGPGVMGMIGGPVEAGRRAGTQVEDTMRLAGFYDLVKKGYLPDVAAAQVRGAHVDYGKLTGFERQVMKRVAPFYSFARGNIPYQLEQMATRPGGATATAVKASGNLRDEQGFEPEYLGQGVALPLGEEQEGIQRYLTGLGLPFESVFDVLNPSTPGRTAETLASQLHPLLKAPAELFTGKQFFSGRELDKAALHSPTGSVLTDQILYNSPLARVASTYKTATDDRKDFLTKLLNIGTGVKVSDVDIEKQRELATKKRLDAALDEIDGIRSFESRYIPKELQPLLSPDEVDLMRLYATQKKKAREKAEKKQPGA